MPASVAVAEPDSARLAVAFGRVVRGAGIDVPVGATIAFARALECVGLATAPGVYWAGRATLVRRPDDIEAYDRAFEAFFSAGIPAPADDEVVTPVTAAFDVELPPDPDDDSPLSLQPTLTVRWSPVEVLRERDFASYTPAEFAQACRLMSDLRLTAATRPSRRRKVSRSRGAPDLRRTVRRSMRAGGEVTLPVLNRAGTRPRSLVLLLDVSGSMEPYARAFVRFVHAAVGVHPAGRAARPVQEEHGDPHHRRDRDVQARRRSIPDGVVIGARGPYGPYAPDNELNQWFAKTFEDRYDVPPNYAAYQMAQAILGTKAAWEKAQAANGGKRPSNDQVIAAFEHLTFESPAGKVEDGDRRRPPGDHRDGLRRDARWSRAR